MHRLSVFSLLLIITMVHSVDLLFSVVEVKWLSVVFSLGIAAVDDATSY